MDRYQRLYTKQFRKDFRRLEKSGFAMSALEQIIDALAADEKLPENCRDHALHGTLKGARECHVRPDWLLLYQKDGKELTLLLMKTGTHRHVLGIE